MKKLTTVLFAAIFFCVKANSQTTVVIQPHFAQGTENAVAHVNNTSSACIGHPFEHYADSNFTVITEFDAITWTAGSCPDFFRSIVRFDELKDTALIPPGAIITSAHLVLYGIPSSPLGNYGNSYYPASPYPGTNPTWLYELADTFDHHAITWNNQPSVMHIDSISIPPSYSRWNQTDTIDVTAMVADMVANVNTGFLLRLQTEATYRERMYAGCYYPDSTLHPKLIVTLACVGGLISMHPSPDTVMEGATAKFIVASSATSTYQWQEDPGTGFVNLAEVWPYSGTTTDTLTIHNASMFLDSTHYRCVVSSGGCSDTSSSAILIVHGSTSVNTMSPASIAVFPNPANDEVTITFPAGVVKGSIELLNELGQRITSKEIAGSTTNINIHQLPVGVYTLKIVVSGQVLYKQVVKK